MGKNKIGVIGGSGLYQIEGMEKIKEVKVKTPFGNPSDAYICGTLKGQDMVFLPRHGRGHRILPSEINFRANIYGMKQLGVTRIISVSAVGSMKEKIKPGHMVVIDQFIDITRHRTSTFFGDGIVAHTMFADPICSDVAAALVSAAKKVKAKVHSGGTYVNMEGPQFSTRAESRLYREWGVDVIGMTNAPEAKLAREAEICYATLALSTDYDCWHEEEEDVTIEQVLEVMNNNVATSKKIISAAIRAVAKKPKCGCQSAMMYSIITDPAAISQKKKKELKLIIGKYIK